jgi:Arm DNA-binding domain
MGKLNPKQIDSLSPGTHGDGNNLYVVVKESGARAYMLRYYWQGRPQKMGLGSTRDVTLAEARDQAIDANRLIAKGINPRDDRDEKRRAEASVLFLGFAEELRLEKEKGFEGLKRFVTERHGWLVSVPGDRDLRLQVLPGSPLPDQLVALGYIVEKTGETQRILPHAIQQRFEVSSSGALVPVTEGSTKPVSVQITNAGIATVEQYDLDAAIWGAASRC